LAREIAISMLPWLDQCPAQVANVINQLFVKSKGWRDTVDAELLDLSFLPSHHPEMAKVMNNIKTMTKGHRDGPK
jgi:hypothetical protein